MWLSCQLYAPTALNPQKDLVVLISLTVLVNLRAIIRLEGLGKLKIFNDLIATGNLDLLACSISASTTYATACPQFLAHSCPKLDDSSVA
jgi:hypothetical protein